MPLYTKAKTDQRPTRVIAVRRSRKLEMQARGPVGIRHQRLSLSILYWYNVQLLSLILTSTGTMPGTTPSCLKSKAHENSSNWQLPEANKIRSVATAFPFAFVFIVLSRRASTSQNHSNGLPTDVELKCLSPGHRTCCGSRCEARYIGWSPQPYLTCPPLDGSLSATGTWRQFGVI